MGEPIDLEAFVAAYLRNCLQDRLEEDEWAWDELVELTRESPEAALELILRLLANCPSKRTISYIAASPLEDLLRLNGHKVWEKIKDEASHNKRLVYALSSVIIKKPLSDEIDTLLKRLQFERDPQFKRDFELEGVFDDEN